MSGSQEMTGQSTGKLKVALLIDDRELSKWQEDALFRISDLVEIVLVLNCMNTVTAKRIFVHGAYYALKMVSIKSSLTRKRTVDFGACLVLDFDSRYEGAWQWIPDDVVSALAESGARTVIKLGMSLLKMDNLTGVDVLSFRHGDPRRYRGRSTGFYEFLHEAKSVGFAVQKLTNVLDGGEVLAFGRAKLYGYSYRKTVQGLYRSSPALLRHAVNNYVAGKSVPIKPKGKNYLLPGNLLVVRFCAQLLVRKIRRLLYGAFWEKRWNIAVFDQFDFRAGNTVTVSDGRSAAVLGRYNFYADPFFSEDGSKLRVEALVDATGRGEIIELDSDTFEAGSTILAGPHFSYPYTFSDGGQEYILPEVAGHEAPYLLAVSDTPRKLTLQGMKHLRIVDPSLVKVDKRYYLFGGHPDSAAGMLQLYVSEALLGPYRPHRMNPIVIDPSCARMGGRILVRDGKLYRFGQDNLDSYGDGIRVMQVTRIDAEAYEEKEVAELRFTDASGPHTVDIRNERAVLDYYVDRFSPLAGYRRIVAKMHTRLARLPAVHQQPRRDDPPDLASDVAPTDVPSLQHPLAAAVDRVFVCVDTGDGKPEHFRHAVDADRGGSLISILQGRLMPDDSASTSRVLIVASYPGSVSGFRGPLIDALIASGCKVHVAAPGIKDLPLIREALEGKGVDLHDIPLRRTGTNPIADLVMLVALVRLMRRLRPTLALPYTIKPVVYGTLAAWMTGVPRRFALITGLGYAFTGNRQGLLRRVVSLLYRFSLTRACKVFYQNPDDERLFRDLGIVPAKVETVVVNGSGVDLAAYAMTPLSPGPPAFLMICRILGNKGVREFAEAARRIRRTHPEVRFRLVGRIDENPDAITQAELDHWGADGTIEFLGRLSDVRPAISDCSVYVLPSYREGTPRTVLEAMAMGRAIITTDAPGCRETVINGENGYLVPVKSVAALVDAMQRFIDDPSLAQRMGRRSRQIAEDKYDVHKVNAVMLREMGITGASQSGTVANG